MITCEQRAPLSTSLHRYDPALKAVVDRLLDITESQNDPTQLEVGDTVRHHIFGVGVIESLRGADLDAKTKVNFAGSGPKLLLLCYARLQKL